MNAPSPDHVLMLTALDLEYDAIRAHLTGLRRHSHLRTSFETGRLPGSGGDITIAVTGEGNSGAAVLTERAISTFSPRALMFVGVAGALKGDISLGDVVVATKIYAYHGGKDEGEAFLARPRAWEAPHELEQLARHVARTQSWSGRVRPRPPDRLPAVHFKPVVAGEVLLNSRGTPLAEHLRRTYNDAVAIEMESAGVSQASHLNGSWPVLTIRGISDRADNTKHATDHAGWQLAAAAHAAAFALALAAEIMKRAAGEPAAAGGAGEPARHLTQDNSAARNKTTTRVESQQIGVYIAGTANVSGDIAGHDINKYS